MKENIILKWSLILSIVIVANLFFNYSLSLTLNSPKNDEFCNFDNAYNVIEDKKTCEELEGIWRSEKKNLEEAGECDLYSKCNNRFEQSLKIYEQKVFIALVIIGVIILALSFFLKNNTVLSSALPLTAVLNFIVASMRYWNYSDELLKVTILFIALLALIYLAIKKFKNITE